MLAIVKKIGWSILPVFLLFAQVYANFNIIIKFGDHQITAEVKKQDTVESLRVKVSNDIQETGGINPYKQAFFFESGEEKKRLLGEKKLFDYGIKADSVIQVEEKEWISITVKEVKNRSADPLLLTDIYLDDTIGSLKKRIMDCKGLTGPEDYKLVIGGSDLKDKKRVSEYNKFEDGETVYLLNQLSSDRPYIFSIMVNSPDKPTVEIKNLSIHTTIAELKEKIAAQFSVKVKDLVLPSKYNNKDFEDDLELSHYLFKQGSKLTVDLKNPTKESTVTPPNSSGSNLSLFKGGEKWGWGVVIFAIVVVLGSTIYYVFFKKKRLVNSVKKRKKKRAIIGEEEDLWVE